MTLSRLPFKQEQSRNFFLGVHILSNHAFVLELAEMAVTATFYFTAYSPFAT